MKLNRTILIILFAILISGCSAVESTGDAVDSIGRGTGNAISGVGTAVGNGVGTVVSGTGDAISEGARKTSQRGY